MPRRGRSEGDRKGSVPDPASNSQSENEEENEELPPPLADPYKVLQVDRNATESEIKKAYRRLALTHHPDKVNEASRDKAHEIFQKIVYAYGILSDANRRKIYDTTGSLDETSGSDFTWKEYFDEMYKQTVTKEMIEQDKLEYRESGEERRDILKYYTESKGNMDYIFENVVHSSVLEDEERFRTIIDGAISEGEVKPYKKYTGESQVSRSSRKKAAKKEAKEAESLAEELGVSKKLMNADEDALGALIKQRQASRMGNFLDDLEKKYRSGSKKRTQTTISEEEFQATQKKLKGGKRK